MAAHSERISPDPSPWTGCQAFVYDLIGFVVALMVMLAGVMNGFGWAIVAIYLLLTLGFGYYALQKSES